MQTEAAVLVEIGKPLEMRSLRIPSLKPGQVLVDVAYSGVCHSQVLEFQGKRGVDRFLPHTLGHEGSGTVLEVGAGVNKVKPGDRVVLTWIKGKGLDVGSTVYESAVGPVNSGAISTFMRQTITCENRLVPIPAEMPLREAALLGCAIPTGAGIVLNTAQVRPGQSLAVFGAGGIGLSAILAARLMNADPIIAVDVVEKKLDQAKAMGATHAINAKQQDTVAAIHSLTKGGADFAIESAGKRESMESAFQATRDGGGLCILAGNLPAGEKIAINPFDLIRGKRIIGTWGGETQPDRDIQLYARLYLTGRLDLSALISHDVNLCSVSACLHELERGTISRAVVGMNI